MMGPSNNTLASSRNGFMLKARGEAVKSLWKTPGKSRELLALSTMRQVYLTSQSIFVPNFYTANAHFERVYRQAKIGVFNLFSLILTTLYTPPNNVARI